MNFSLKKKFFISLSFLLIFLAMLYGASSDNYSDSGFEQTFSNDSLNTSSTESLDISSQEVLPDDLASQAENISIPGIRDEEIPQGNPQQEDQLYDESPGDLEKAKNSFFSVILSLIILLALLVFIVTFFVIYKTRYLVRRPEDYGKVDFEGQKEETESKEETVSEENKEIIKGKDTGAEQPLAKEETAENKDDKNESSPDTDTQDIEEKSGEETEKQLPQVIENKTLTKDASTDALPASNPKIEMIASGDKRFFASDGKIIDSIRSLKEALAQMSEETFYSHVNNEKNDFSNWISNVFENPALAEKIRLAKKEEMIELLGDF